MVSGSRVLLRLEVFKVLKVCKDFKGERREKKQRRIGGCAFAVWGLTAGGQCVSVIMSL